ncbi:TetR/AcrR family transcriptional regulator [Shimia biformata]|uniref:TetR/AcrR family transcriptional regulator n=1 Tax=Shimia biformata TaxID=1294299 RepID=UPI00194E8944|nr:TetR/AcrR family transcriptional regulator [Shimia biformata]
MKEAIQPRTLKTRARLIDAARQVISETGYGALRVEEVVQRAGVAKGTFFAHFRDKDALMDHLIGVRIDACLDDLAAAPAPATVADMVATLDPLMQLMTCERYVFDVIVRHSGAAAIEEIGPIAMTFHKLQHVLENWVDSASFRRDASPQILAEGVQAFMVNAMALNFCALSNTTPLSQRLEPYLSLWLKPD